jgi:hypothetical protein
MSEHNSSSRACNESKATNAESTPTEHIERSDVGVSLTVKLKRGTGTRDEDQIKAKVKAKTLNDARDDMDELRAYVRDLAGEARQIQPTKTSSDLLEKVFSLPENYLSMPPSYSRRSLVCTMGTALSVGMAGCASSPETSRVTVTIVNLTNATQSVQVSITNNDDTVWKQTANLPQKQPENPSKIETQYALTGIEEGSSFNVNAKINKQEDVTTAPLVVDDTSSDPVESVVVRITGDNRIGIATPRT